LAGRANLRSPITGGIAQLVERLVRNDALTSGLTRPHSFFRENSADSG
jgi:hypothetical protein